MQDVITFYLEKKHLIQFLLSKKLMFFVYCIQNNINLKIYIGKTNNIQLRFKHHIKISNRGFYESRKTFNLIHKAIRKYGKDNFNYQVIEEFEDETDALEAEKFWIEFFRTDINRYGNEFGYNLTNGGKGISGYKHSQKTKDKISESLLGKKRSKEDCERIKIGILNSKRNYSRKLNLCNKVNWVDDDNLLCLVNLYGYKKVGKIFGVSDNAVRGRLKRRNLLHKVTYIRNYN